MGQTPFRPKLKKLTAQLTQKNKEKYDQKDKFINHNLRAFILSYS